MGIGYGVPGIKQRALDIVAPLVMGARWCVVEDSTHATKLDQGLEETVTWILEHIDRFRTDVYTT